MRSGKRLHAIEVPREWFKRLPVDATSPLQAQSSMKQPATSPLSKPLALGLRVKRARKRFSVSR